METENFERCPGNLRAPLERVVSTRAAFEQWISGPPYEREVERFGERSAWPGNYRKLDVDLAWRAWSAATATERARWRPAAEKARAALSELLMTRDPLVYSDALRALDEVLGPNAF